MPLSEVRARVSVSEGLTPEDMQELLSSGQPVFTNRISWAVVYVAGAGLVEKVRRGVYRLTAGGERLLAQAPARIDKNVLRGYPAYVEWSARRSVRSPNRDTAPAPPDDSADTPEEALERAARQLHGALEGDVLDRVREAAPEFLERLVVDLLIAIGYGGGDAERGRVTGRSGDGGIDGTIREDALGLDEVYLQAKRYAGTTVGKGDLQNFAGAIDAANTTKGVFVTTAGFTKSAKDYVAKSPKRIVLIDGEELARLMVKHNIGVRRKIQYDVKRIDEDYFDLEGL
jgi:restriction system protein